MERPLSNFERLHAEVSGKLAPLQGTPFSSSFAHARSSVALKIARTQESTTFSRRYLAVERAVRARR